jgi:maleylacetate reductase
MRSFSYESLPGRVVFGAGSVERLPEEVERLGGRRVFLIADPAHGDLADRLAGSLGKRLADVFGDIEQHVPVEAAGVARDAADRSRADCIVTVGGGSTTGFGKVVTLESNLPSLAVPTTYAGSEMTPIYGMTVNGKKETARDLRVLPKTVIYDPALTVSLPPSVTGPSGMNALAHCVEALYAKEENPITSLMAEEGIRALVRGIPRAVQAPGDLEARTEALYGAYLAGAALAVVGMAIHHRVCHVLGGTYGLSHGDVNAVILPHAVRYNQDAAPVAMRRIAGALGVQDPATGIFDFARSIQAPASLAELGMAESDLPDAARLAAVPPSWNPRPVLAEDVKALLAAAHRGVRPESAIEERSEGVRTGDSG